MLIALSIACDAIDMWWNALEVVANRDDGDCRALGHFTEGDARDTALLVFLFPCLAINQAIMLHHVPQCPNQLDQTTMDC